MRRRKIRLQEEHVNMTPMIDIVFQMIIFFVCTVQLEKLALNDNITLALAQSAPAVEKKDPRTVTVDVDGKGRISIGNLSLTLNSFKGVMKKSVSLYGQTIPVVIRGDGEAHHNHIRRVMDACSEAGLWKVKFAATKDYAKKQ